MRTLKTRFNCPTISLASIEVLTPFKCHIYSMPLAPSLGPRIEQTIVTNLVTTYPPFCSTTFYFIIIFQSISISKQINCLLCIGFCCIDSPQLAHVNIPHRINRWHAIVFRTLISWHESLVTHHAWRYWVILARRINFFIQQISQILPAK